MARRRFVPLIACVVLGLAALVARLYQVQIGEGEIWAAQAANLVRSGEIEPYVRGAILDARGRVLARDETVYRVQFNYREFRRGHPLGMVAHARSTLLGANVPLRDALLHLDEWGRELVQLTPAALSDFAEGRSLTLGATLVPACARAEDEDRRARRSDARFYVTQLLELEPADARALAKKAREQPAVPLYALAAEVRGVDADGLLRRVQVRLAECSLELEGLAQQLERDALAAGDAAGEAAPLEALLARLEGWRESVEDDAASELFRNALGFPAGRVEAGTLATHCDLRWIQRLLLWDEARTEAWLVRAREHWLASLLRGQVERISIELEFAAAREDLPDFVLSQWAELFTLGEPASEDESGVAWREPRPLAVLDELAELFSAPPDDDEEGAPPLLPFQDPEFLGVAAERLADWSCVARAELGPAAGDAEVAALAARWAQLTDGRFDRKFAFEHSAAALERWDAELQGALASSLARRRGSPEAPKLALAEGRLDRAWERASYVLKDRGSRPQVVANRPSYETVHLLSRHRDRFAGFSVQETGERVRLVDERGMPLAGTLVGRVGAPTLRDLRLERERRDEFGALQRKGERSADDRARLLDAARSIARPDEPRGRSGIEAHFDAELAGRNGYRERRGLQEVVDSAFTLELEPQNGSELVLTLDAEVQDAARRSLAEPDGDPLNPGANDYGWLDQPTGSIVFASVDGDVLAAASFPDFDRDPDPRASHRDRNYERTLRKPGFQPPGSSFKPFVAAWGLDHRERLQFDPLQREPCAALADGRPGYVDVHCNATHGSVDLRSALQQSCNSYFARLGERFEVEDWRGLAEEFGFGQPTGVRAWPARGGLSEDTVPGLFAFKRGYSGTARRMAGNGLAEVEVTPMQLARALCALATGVLPRMRLVRSVGGVEQPREGRPLTLSASSLEYVRDGMFAVANESLGSAQHALNFGELGFRMGAKTGSGDIDTRRVSMTDGRERVLKYTWLVGFLPYENPRYVVVVECCETLATASHGASWLARQFLTQPAVKALVLAPQERR